MDGSPGPALRHLAAVYAIGGACCWASARWPMSARSPVGLCWVLGALGLVVAALLLTVARRAETVSTHLATALLTALIALLAGRTVTPTGMVGLGPVMVVLAVHTAHALPPAAARAHVLALVAATTAGAALAPARGFWLPWSFVLLAVLTVAQVQSRLVGQLRRAASTDALTGLASRGSWEEQAARLLAGAARRGRPFSVAVLDLDAFKQVNDTHGHSAGDALLRELSRHWSARVRSADVLGRHGGDEFVLAMPDTDAATASDVVERLREGAPGSWSAGVASTEQLPGAPGLHALLEAADAELYRRKALVREQRRG